MNREITNIPILNETRIDSTNLSIDVSSDHMQNGEHLLNSTLTFSSSEDALSVSDRTPPIDNIDTPDISQDLSDQEISVSSEADQETADGVLKEIRVKNINKVIIGTLNINSLAPKFELLREVIGKNLDVITIQETKLDSSFPPGQFLLDGYAEPYRLDRNRDGGGVMIYVREDIPSKLLNKHNFTSPIEGLFIEINRARQSYSFSVLTDQTTLNLG